MHATLAIARVPPRRKRYADRISRNKLWIASHLAPPPASAMYSAHRNRIKKWTGTPESKTKSM